MTVTETTLVSTGAYLAPLDVIQPSTTNPRKTFRTEGLDELAASIRKYGVLQPILVRKIGMNGDEPVYEIIAGERRYRASKLAEMTTIPCRVVDVSDLDVLELQIIENLQREDLHPLEEAESYEALLKNHADDTQHYGAEEIAAKVGKSKAYIYARMKLCALLPEARQAFYDGNLTPSTALLLARIPVPDLQIKALGEITAESYRGVMSYRDAATHIQNTYMLRLDQAKFKIADESLLPAAGPCTSCPKRTGANPDLFDDVGRADVCTDPMCFADKKAAHAERLRVAALESGKKVITGKEAKKIKPDKWSDTKGYVKPDDSPWWLDGQKSIKKTLGKDMPESVLLEDPYSGDMIEIVPEDQVRDALKAKGCKVSRSSSPSNAEARALEVKTKAARTYRRAVLRAVHDASASRLRNGETLSQIDLQVIVDHAYVRLGADSRPSVAELWGWPGKDVQTARDAIGLMGPDDLATLLLDIALASETYVSPWSLASDPEELHAAAERYGIDTKAIKRSLAPEKKPVAAKKPAAGTATKTKGAPKNATKAPAIVPIKYFHPYSGATWSGRGKPPRWILLEEEKGVSREQFLSQTPAADVPTTDADPAPEPAESAA